MQTHGSSRDHRELDRAAAAAAAAAVATAHGSGRDRDHRAPAHGQVGDRKKVRFKSWFDSIRVTRVLLFFRISSPATYATRVNYETIKGLKNFPPPTLCFQDSSLDLSSPRSLSTSRTSGRDKSDAKLSAAAAAAAGMLVVALLSELSRPLSFPLSLPLSLLSSPPSRGGM